MQQSIHLPQDLYDAVTRRAQNQKKTPDDLVVEWVYEKVGESEQLEVEAAFENEIAAFDALKAELLQQYPDQYVAIYQGQVVGHGEDRLSLVKEVYAQFGEVPCYIEKATTEPMRRVRIPSVWKAK